MIQNSGSKNILLIYYKLFKPGGVARVLVSLANELIEQGYNISIMILTSDRSSFYQLDPRVTVIYIDTFSHWGFRKINVGIDKYFRKLPARQNIKNYIYDFGQWDMLSKWLKQNHQNYDSIISCWYKLSAQLALNKKVNYKTIAWEHTSFHVGGLLWNKLLRKYYRNLKNIVSINSPGEKYYKSISPNVCHIPNMMSEDIENITETDYNQKENVILIPSRLDSDKNLTEFLDIVSLIDFKDDWKVKIFGNGMQEKILKDKITKDGLKNVYLNNALSPTEILGELRKSKIICMTSLKEGLPTILIEGLFTSNALISYNCNYGPSDIVNKENGYLIPMHDKKMFAEKLQYLIDNPHVLEELNKSSYKESAKWRKEKIIQQWKNLIDN
ncbi:glycosyltransferase [Chryseobacterium sp. TY3]